jgi:O-antigen/teichoic acid export membrane protein
MMQWLFKSRWLHSQSVLFVGFRFLAQIVARFGNFLLFPLMARHLGTEGYGVQTQLNAINGVLLPVATLGLGFSVVRLIAGKHDSQYITARFLSTLLLTVGAASALGLVIVIAAPLLNSLFIKVDQAVSVLRLSAVMLVVMAVQNTLRDYYRARLRIVAYSVFEIVEAIVTVIIMALVFSLGGMLWEITLAWITIKLVLVLVMIAYFGYIKEIRLPVGLMPRAEMLDMIRFGIPVISMGISSWVIGLGDRAVLGYFLNSSAVGLYGSAYTLAGLLGSLAVAFWGPLYPLMAQYKNTGDALRLTDVCRRYTNAYALIGIPALFGLTILSSAVLRVIGSDEFSIHPALFGLIALGLFSDQMATNTHYLIYLHNEPSFLRNSTIFSGLLNILLNILLVPMVGIWGSALATLITYFSLDILLARKVIAYGYKLSDLYDGRTLAKFTLSALVMSIGVYLLQRGLGITTTGLVVSISGGMVLYGFALLTTNGFRTQGILGNIRVAKTT